MPCRLGGDYAHNFHGASRTDEAAMLAGSELDNAATLCVEGVIPAPEDIHARVDLRAALADDYFARADLLAGKKLNAEALGCGLAA